MSLLMDALKKAEQAKQLGQTEEAAAKEGPAAALRLEPLAAAPAGPEADAAPAAAPEPPPHLEVLDAEFMDQMRRSAAAKPAAPAAAPGTGQPQSALKRPAAAEPAADPAALRQRQAAAIRAEEQTAAKNVFDAKQAPAGRNKAFAITVGVATLLAVAGIGTYFWLQLQPAGGLAAGTTSPTSRPAASVPAPATPPPSPVATPAAMPPTPEAVRPAAPEISPAAASAATLRSPAAAQPAPDSPIRITTSKSRINPALVKAFDALNAGNLAAAQTDYGGVLKAEPRNADALLGMAAIALRQGQYDQAEEYYLRAVEADPKNAVAQAGLFGLRGQVDPVNSESRLKTLIAAQPDQPFLQFALGNIYVAGGRWSEAQQAFFKAYTGDPEHPDYLFNLAVSLDHLRQSKLAAQYYNQALAAADRRPASFDKAQAATRLRELQP